MSQNNKKVEDKTGVTSHTQTVTVKKSPNVVLKLQTSDASTSGRRVQWDQTAVDNENMNKKKSKCCCIYTKPKAFDESGSETEDDDHHCTTFCRGHLEKDFKHDPKEEEVESAKPDIHQPDGSSKPPTQPPSKSPSNGSPKNLKPKTDTS